MIPESSLLVRVHDRAPSLETHGKARLPRLGHFFCGPFREHDEGGAGRSRPSLLGSGDYGIDAKGRHVGPDGAGCDAVQHEETSDVVHGLCGPADVFVGKYHARGSFDVGREHDRRTLLENLSHDVVDGMGSILHVRTVGVLGFDWLRLENRVRSGNGIAGSADVEDFRPAIGEPAIADDHDVFVGSELPGYCLHAKGTRTRHDCHLVSIIRSLQQIVQISHDLLKGLAHQI
mmetsp:Transcript_16360/g.39151  ORF Transcript_16360/g.39151 Transcript_16360/m.39151 type:complete len:232 (+) Transcript_16360:611-1306(+)